jgi:polar amino acid transport system substrate-binding protein
VKFKNKGVDMRRVITLVFTALLSSVGFVMAQDLEGRVLKIGSDTTYPPLETVDENGNIVGFDVDVMNAICEKINCTAEFVTTAWDGIFVALANGEFDMVVSGVSITEERDKIVDFSDPYLVVSQAILVRVEDEGLTVDDFKAGGIKLAAQTGTTNADLAVELVGRGNVSLYDTFSSAVEALKNADVSGVIIDGTSALAYEQEFAGELTVAITGLNSDPLGLVFQEDSELVDAFNAGLQMIKDDGTLDNLIAKYWGETGQEN